MKPNAPTKRSDAPAGAVLLDRERARSRALDLARFVDASPMPYQGCAESVRRLRAAGFEPLSEGDAWELEAGRGYFVVRADTTVVAFRLGRRAPSSTGFRVVGAHLDSPNLRVKPQPEVASHGYRQLGVEVYGSPILASWLDRDLGIAGRVVVQAAKGGRRTRLVEVRRPVARVANLAIHLNRKINDEGLRVDKQRHLPPFLGLDATAADGEPWSLRRLVAREIDCAPEEILAFDLGLFDLQPSALGGVEEEFLFAPRLDNLGSSHAGLVALCEAAERVKSPETSWVLALYDHEECGSQSHQGAMGTVLRDVMTRLSAAHPLAEGDAAEEAYRALARTFMISADMAHAVHPSHAEVHEPEHRPRLNRGPVLKRNDNQRYATDGDTGARFVALCREAGFEPQAFVSRTDLPCGTTIGPIAAAASGVPVVDVGNPMLSMHSVRECAGAWDQDLMIEAFARHFR